MTTLSYADAKIRPISSDAEIEHRVRALLGTALREQLWALFLDEAQHQRELVIPIADHPADPEPTAVDYLTGSLAEVVRMQGGGSLILVRERRGDASIGRADSSWADELSASCERTGVALRAVLLCHDDGVRFLHARGG